MKKIKFKSKFFSEFKKFITRGNVLDLAVGMIIGSAFTAVVNGLVNYIFKPLINAIPLGDVKGLITMLVAKDATGAITNNPALIDMSKSIFIDWGSFIMAIVNFFITALVLFIIIKSINSFRSNFDKVKDEFTSAFDDLNDEKYKALRKQGMSRKDIKALREKELKDAQEKQAAEEAEKKRLEELNKPATTEELLTQIRDLLQENK